MPIKIKQMNRVLGCFRIFFLGVVAYYFGDIFTDLLLNFVKGDNLAELGIVSITPFAVTMSFSGLMYSRARAIESKRIRFRSVYIAERLLVAAGFYLISLILTFLVYQVAIKYNLESRLGDHLIVAYFFPFIFFVSFLIELFAVIGLLEFNFSGRLTKFVALEARRLMRKT